MDSKKKDCISVLKQIETFCEDLSKAPITLAEKLIYYIDINCQYQFVRYLAIGGESVLLQIKKDNKFYVAKFALPWIYEGTSFRNVWNLIKFAKFVSKEKQDDYTEDSYRFADGCHIQSQINSVITKKSLGMYGYVPYVIESGRQGILYYIMEYVEGQNILDWAKRSSKVNKIEFFHSLVCLVNYAFHCHGVIHRDLKYDNILVSGGESPKPIILDFGLCKNTSIQKKIPTANNTKIGSPLFGSPEQLKKLKSSDFRSDIFMLGTLFWIIWKGKEPVTVKNRDEVDCIWEYFPVDVFPLELQRIYELCTAQDPIDRYQEIGDLQRDLEKVILPTEKPAVVERIETRLIEKAPQRKLLREYTREEIAEFANPENVEPIYNIVNGFIRLFNK